MANDEQKIKQKIELTGEKQYSQAIASANRNLKTLRSELKAETAELGKNATEQQKNQAKAKSLQKQIQEQEKVVKACRDALDEVREKYSDNEEAMAKYEQKLNAARTTLANMRTALEDCGDAFADAGSEASQSNIEVRAFAESVQTLASAANTVSDAIGGLFSGMVDVVREAITAVWSDVTELAGRANAWADLAGYWNTSAANIQKWYHSVQGAFDNFEDLSNAVTRIVMGDQKKIAEATGVSSAAYEDQWEYAMAVMDALSKMEYKDQTEALGEIFGEKRATKVADLVNDWEKIVELTERFDAENGGLGMTQEQLDDMSTVAEQVATINETWNAFKDSFIAGVFGQVSLDLAGNAQGILEALIRFTDARNPEEQQAALDELTKQIEDFFTRIGEAIQAAADGLREAGTRMQESENGWISTIGSILQGLADTLEWFTKEDNINKVIWGFEALAGVWAGSKILAAIGTLGSLIANLRIIKATGGIFGGLFSGAKNTAEATGTGSGGSGVYNIGKGAGSAAKAAGELVSTTGMGALGTIGTIVSNYLTSTGGMIGQALLLGIPMADRARKTNWDRFMKDSKSDLKDLGSSIEGVASATPEQNRRSFQALWKSVIEGDLLENENKGRDENAGGGGSHGFDVPEIKPEETAEDAAGNPTRTLSLWKKRYSQDLLEAAEESQETVIPGLTEEVKAGWQRFLEECEKEWPETGVPGLTKEVAEGWSIFTANAQEIAEAEEAAASGLTETQRAAAEAFWDEWRAHPEDFSDEAWDEFEAAFAGMEDVFDELNRRMEYLTQGEYEDTWRDMEDIPASVWGDGLSDASSSMDNAAATMKGLPGLIQAAVRSGVSNIMVTMDGEKVGALVTPYVSQGIARALV